MPASWACWTWSPLRLPLLRACSCTPRPKSPDESALTPLTEPPLTVALPKCTSSPTVCTSWMVAWSRVTVASCTPTPQPKLPSSRAVFFTVTPRRMAWVAGPSISAPTRVAPSMTSASATTSAPP